LVFNTVSRFGKRHALHWLDI